MQNTKDSFYIALRDRLAAVNPARIVSINGVTRPAIAVVENELATAGGSEANTFYLRWKAARGVAGFEGAPQPLLELQCEIVYWTEGSSDLSHEDRGRELAALDADLAAIAEPARAAVKDFTQTPPQPLGSALFWSRPRFEEIEAEARKLLRAATLNVWVFSEANH